MDIQDDHLFDPHAEAMLEMAKHVAYTYDLKFFQFKIAFYDVHNPVSLWLVRNDLLELFAYLP